MRTLGGPGVMILVALVAGCGGATDPDADGRSDAGSIPDSALVEDGSGSDAAASDASTSAFDGLAPDPGFVQCGTGAAAACAIASNYCCIDLFDGGSACRPDTVSSCGGDRKACDEAADCKGSTPLCCSPPSSAAPPRYHESTFCAPTCASYQVCKTSAECVNGKPCVSQICRGRAVQTCGPLPKGACDS